MKSLYTLANISVCAAVALGSATQTPRMMAADFTSGAIVINENQYGKSDSSINHLDIADGKWSYGVFSAANPGHVIGGTACSGGYDASSLYIVCKDVSAPGADLEGGILTAVSAADMSLRWQLKNLDPSGKRAAGRGFLAINDSKAYVSSSNGIWVINTVDGSVKQQIAGSENPFGIDDKPVTDPTSTLYVGQCGSMVKLNGKVFAAHQEKGLLVINPETDILERIILMDDFKEGAGIGSVVAGSDGYIWFSISDSTDGYGIPLNMLGRLDTTTMDVTTVEIPEGMFGPSQNWSAWTTDTFCSSSDGYLYWTGGEDIWYSNMLVFRHEIATGITSLILDFNDNEEGWKVCTPSMRVDPSSNLLYMTLFKDYASTEYTVRSYTSDGVAAKDFPMKRSYWFCGTILFPESAIAGVENVTSGSLPYDFSVRYSEGALTVTGLNSGDAVIYDMQGRIVAQIPLSEEGITFARIALPSGIQLVATPAGAVKIRVR